MKLGIQKPETPSKPVDKPVEKTVSKPVVASTYTLPTQMTEPVGDLGDLTILLYGERKIGKTSLAAAFPGVFIFAFEKGYKGLRVYVDLMEDTKGNTNTPAAWRKFKQAVNVFVEGKHPHTKPVIDTIDMCYEACMAYVCDKNGWEHPTDKEAAYGKGWVAVNNEFIEVIGKLVNRYGVIFISHATEREFKDRLGGVFDKIVPTMTQQAKKYASSVADVICYYGYYGNERLITIRGSDSVESGSRLANNFFIEGGEAKYREIVGELKRLKTEGKLTPKLEQEIQARAAECKVHSIPAGIDYEDAYDNFKRAFNNRQPYTGSPDSAKAVLSDVRAPLQSGKKKEGK